LTDWQSCKKKVILASELPLDSAEAGAVRIETNIRVKIEKSLGSITVKASGRLRMEPETGKAKRVRVEILPPLGG